MEVLKTLNLALRLLLEVGALAACGHWGWRTGRGGARWVLAGAAVLAVIVVWVLFVSPDPTIELARPFRLAIEFGVWLAAGAALYATGRPRLGAAFVIVAIISGTANYLWD